jgi:hypothetical protein
VCFCLRGRVRGGTFFRPFREVCFFAYVTRVVLKSDSQTGIPDVHKCLARALVLPKILEPLGRQLGVSNRVLDIFVPEVMLERPRVVPVVGELEPAGVT